MNSSLVRLSPGRSWYWAALNTLSLRRLAMSFGASFALLLLIMNWAPGGLAAQTRPAASWRDSLGLLDSSSPADTVAAESILRESIAHRDAPPEAICAFALVRLRQEESADALALISSLPTRYSAADLEKSQALALRVRLCAALMIRDAQQADSAFKDLVRLIVAETADPVDLRYGAITVAVVVAMLEPDLAKSPIAKRDLAIGRDCMLNCRIHGVASAYTSAYAQASDRAGELVRQFALIADKGLDAIAAEHQSRMQSLGNSLDDLALQKELAGEIFRNAREQTQQNTRDRRKLENQIATLMAKSRQATPGHPGPPRPAPPLPAHPSTIHVDEYETRTEWEYVIRNDTSFRVPVTRQVRRSQHEIDRERDLMYQRMLDDYKRVKDDYDRYARNYQTALKSWTEADGLRRLKLDDERAEAEAKRAELIASSELIKEQQRETAKEISAKRNEKEQEAFELELQGIALAAVQAQDIAEVFRPRNFPVISWSQEKALLQRNTLPTKD